MNIPSKHCSIVNRLYPSLFLRWAFFFLALYRPSELIQWHNILTGILQKTKRVIGPAFFRPFTLATENKNNKINYTLKFISQSVWLNSMIEKDRKRKLNTWTHSSIVIVWDFLAIFLSKNYLLNFLSALWIGNENKITVTATTTTTTAWAR